MDSKQLNKHFQSLEIDYLYHLGLDSSMDLSREFGDIANVIFTRSPTAAGLISQMLATEYLSIHGLVIHCATIAKHERYHMYKLGQTIVISHGIGAPSLLICLNEITKLLFHAGVTNANYLRIGPGGGLGLALGSVVIANEALSPLLEAQWRNIEFGEYHSYSTIMDASLVQEIIKLNSPSLLIHGRVLSSDSFYAGQGRLNGALVPSFSVEERDNYLKRAYAAGVRAIDLESSCFSAFCQNLKIPAAILVGCVSDRFHDQENEPSLGKADELAAPLMLASKILIKYILAQNR